MAVGIREKLKTGLSKERIERFSIYLLPIISVLAVLAILLTIVWPRISTSLLLRKSIEDQESRVKILAEKAEKLKSADLEDVRYDLNRIRDALPDDKDALGLIIGLERLAFQSGVIIERVTTNPGEIERQQIGEPPSQAAPGKQEGSGEELEPSGQEKERKEVPSSLQPPPAVAPPTGGVQSLPAQIAVRGTFSTLEEFVRNLFESNRLLSVKNIAVSSPSSSEGGLTVSITLETFWLSLPRDLGPIDTPLATLTSEEKEIIGEVLKYRVVSGTTFEKSSGKANPFAF